MPNWARIGIELLAGAVLAYGVAVYCVLRSWTLPDDAQRRVVVERIDAKRHLHEFRCEARWFGVVLMGRAIGPGEFMEYGERGALAWKARVGDSAAKPVLLEPGEEYEDVHPDAWALFQRFGVVEGLQAESPVELTAGWPWPVARCWFTNLYGDPIGASRPRGQVGVSGGVRVLDPPGIGALGVIPTTPIWSGLALSTLFYGVVVHALVSAASFARGQIRRRRGLCAKCAYPVRSLAKCPECGTAVRGFTPAT